MKVIIGMSGGVDSSVAAYLLKEQGYEVEGVSFILEERRLKPRNYVSTCCSLESVLDAKKTAELIGINHTMVNLRYEFSEYVIQPFIRAYSMGLTPNPCILCNEHIKFIHLGKIADERGAEYIATGHYARVEPVTKGHGDPGTRRVLKKGVDRRKDQSYVLYVLKDNLLDRLLLPLGWKRKDEVREIARRMNLPSAKRPESQEICFVGGRNYFRFLDNLAEGNSGPVIEWGTDKVLGRHKGIYLYTVGQRKRLGIATGKPLYVVMIDPSRNAVYVGPKEAALAKEFVVGDINRLKRDTFAFERSECRATVKIRSTMNDEPATTAFLGEDTARVVFDEPQWAPAPGQSAVFYHDEAVLGGGVIREVVMKGP